MFWIGFIVGMITLIAAVFAFIAWCFYVTKVDYVEYCDMRDAVAEAVVNRESTITVTHDDEVLSSVTLKEK
jgi:hypothetical protein